MEASGIPTKFPLVWAEGAASGNITTPIPNTSSTLGRASLTLGFPPATAVPIAAGGSWPFQQDFNGILQEITQWNQWQQAGGPIAYDATFQTAIGGYPKGAVLSAASIGGFWLSTVDNNTTDPDTGGAGWVGFSSIHGSRVFASSGTFTVPAGVTIIKVTCTGGGGGGASCNSTFPATASNDASGGGGGAGGTAIGSYTVTPGQAIAITIGAGGAAQASGGTSSAGGLCSSTGGAGTQFQALGTSAGGSGGAGAGGTVNINGGFGSDGQSGVAAFAGNGGASYWGGGTRAYAALGSALTAAAPGGGGGGAYNGTNAGGAGISGVVFIEW
jgi:hypothetical protein